MFGIKINPKTFFATRKFIRQGTKAIQKQTKAVKITHHIAKDGTIVLLGYEKDATRFSASLAKMPNGDVIGKQYRTGSYWLPFKTRFRQIWTKITKANNPNVPEINKIYESNQFGENAKPIITKKVASKLGYMTKTTDTGKGISNIEIFFANTGQKIKKSIDAAGNLISRTVETISQ